MLPGRFDARFLLLCLGLAVGAGCSDSTEPSRPGRVTLSSAEISLDAIGATVTLRAAVVDQHDEAMTDVPIAWASDGAAVVVAHAAGDSAVLRAASAGRASVTATAGKVVATAGAEVVQLAAAMQKTGGDRQNATVGTTLTRPLEVKVTDRLGVPVPGLSVSFAVTQGGGAVSQSSAVTDANGVATTAWTLGTVVGVPQEATASVQGLGAPAVFVAGVRPGLPAKLTALQGDGQTGPAGLELPVAIIVRLADSFDNPLAGDNLDFGGARVVADAQGIARYTWRLAQNALGRQTLIVGTTGLSPLTFSATAVPGSPAKMTAVAGANQSAAPGEPVPVAPAVKVTDQFGHAIGGAAVTFAVTAGGGSVTGASQTTDLDGVARVGRWTLGAAGTNSLSASVAGASVAPFLFHASTVAPPLERRVAVQAGSAQAVMAGTAVPIRPAVVVHDGAGRPVPGETVTFSVVSGGGGLAGAVATTDATGVATVGGWTLGAQGGRNEIVARVATSPSTSVSTTFWASGCYGGGGAGYDITLCPLTTLSTAQRATITGAAARWSAIITDDLSDFPGSVIPAGTCGSSPRLSVDIDDLVIFVEVQPIDGSGGTLAVAGPCYIRSVGSLPTVGLVRLDQADTGGSYFGSVVLHEMGHVLGIGTLWPFFSLMQNPSIVDAYPLDTYYAGAGGRAGFDLIGGATYTGGQKVPVENLGGDGTINSHWRESVLANELMTGYVSAGANPLSALSARSLEDMGYRVNAALADPFSLALSLRSGEGPRPGATRLLGDVYRGPLYRHTTGARAVRVR